MKDDITTSSCIKSSISCTSCGTRFVLLGCRRSTGTINKHIPGSSMSCTNVESYSPTYFTVSSNIVYDRMCCMALIYIENYKRLCRAVIVSTEMGDVLWRTCSTLFSRFGCLYLQMQLFYAQRLWKINEINQRDCFNWFGLLPHDI